MHSWYVHLLRWTDFIDDLFTMVEVIRRLDSTKSDAGDRETVELWSKMSFACVRVSLDRRSLVRDEENYNIITTCLFMWF